MMENVITNKTQEAVLKDLVDKLMLTAGGVNDPGLFNGKMGIAIFLYHYARCYNYNPCYELADRLIDEVCDNMEDITFVDYSDGLAGIGAGFEYLVANGFIEADTNELLADVDRKLFDYVLQQMAGNQNRLQTITGLGKYFLLRVHTLSSDADVQKARNCLERIVDWLERPYQGYRDLINVIDFLSAVYPLHINQRKSRYYLDYAIDKMETMVHEDIHFQLFPTDFNPFRMAAVLLLAHNRMEHPAAEGLAAAILSNYATKCNRHIVNEPALKQALVLAKVCSEMQPVHLTGPVQTYLSGYLHAQTETPLNLDDIGDPGMLTGSAGEGMALLTLTGQISMEWLNDWVGYY